MSNYRHNSAIIVRTLPALQFRFVYPIYAAPGKAVDGANRAHLRGRGRWVGFNEFKQSWALSVFFHFFNNKEGSFSFFIKFI